MTVVPSPHRVTMTYQFVPENDVERDVVSRLAAARIAMVFYLGNALPAPTGPATPAVLMAPGLRWRPRPELQGPATVLNNSDATPPAIDSLRAWSVEHALAAEFRGPLPADTAFHHHRVGELDGVVAMYHDQGLGPFKLAHFYDGVNVTLGLPFVRTSPDHGTAKDIAGRGLADPASLLAAIQLARSMAARRAGAGRGG